MLMYKEDEKKNTGRFPAIAGALSVLLGVYFWLTLGPLLAQIFSKFTIEDPILKAYLVANAPFFSMALGLLLSLRFLLRTTPKAIITDKAKPDWTLMLLCGAAYFGLAVLFTLGHALVQPQFFHPSPSTEAEILRMLPFVLIITPIQTTSEEFLMRAIPSRIFRKGRLVTKSRSILWVSLFTALLFTLPHLSNQEMLHANQKWAVLLYYALFGFGGTFLSLHTRGFEPSLGIHAANNLYIALICNYTNSSLPSRSLFISTAPVGTYLDVLQLVLGLGAVALVLHKSKAFSPLAS